jgi:hypothetical protein
MRALLVQFLMDRFCSKPEQFRVENHGREEWGTLRCRSCRHGARLAVSSGVGT